MKIKKTSFILFLTLIFISLIACDNDNLNNNEKTILKFSDTKELMDTFVTITIYSDNEKKANNALELAFLEIEKIEKKFNIFENNSQIYKLNKNNYLITDDLEIKYLINQSIKYYYLTNESFDITIQPILDLYTKSFMETNKPPADSLIEEYLNYIGSDKIIINDTGIYFLNDKINITLGGIVKGYAVDTAVNTLKDNNITSGLVNAGGDLFAFGKKPNNEKFIVGLTNPDNTTEFIEKFSISNKATATSGNYERYFDLEKKSHHILSPITGKSAQGIISTTVISDSATKADALSTAIFILGEKKGIELINELENTEALIITIDKELFYSNNFKENYN